MRAGGDARLAAPMLALDLLVFKDGRRIGLEIKRTDAPRLSASMRSAVNVLAPDELHVIHAGTNAWQLDESAWALRRAVGHDDHHAVTRWNREHGRT